MNQQGLYHFDFNATALGLTPGSTGVFDFLFTPDPGNTTHSRVTIENLTAKQSNGWSVSSSNLSSVGPTATGPTDNVVEHLNFNDFFKSPDVPFQSTIDFNNYDLTTGAFKPAELTLPVDSIGSQASFDLNYLDETALDPSTFSVSLNGKSIYSLQLAPGGQSFGTNIGAGSTVTGLNGTPSPQVGGTPAVPEPSSFALMGLGALPLLGVVRARRRAARA